MKLICSHCTKSFIAINEQIKLINESKIKGMSFIMLQCQICLVSYSYNPLKSEGYDVSEEPISNEFLCPKETCSGIVSYIEKNKDKLFWGCGRCGNVWFNKSDLYTDINHIINKYPYRALVYIVSENQYLPIPNQDVPNSYEDMVKMEWDK